MNTETLIKEQIATHPILLYMKGSPDFPQCGFSGQAVAVLRACGIQNFAHVNVLEYPDIRQTLPIIAKWPTFPQLYVNGELIGGSDIMMEMYQSGELQTLLESIKTT